MTRIISALFILISSFVLSVQGADAPIELAADAPNRHVVVPGDTLWGISSKFLKDPFRWNELWKLNADEVKNPHWIYPGQVLVITYVDGQPRLGIAGEAGGIPTVKLDPQVRITNQTQEISAIPQQAIEPFLSQPLVVEEDALEGAPRIIAVQNNRVFTGQDDLAYVNKLPAGAAQLWQIYRPGAAMKDPKTGDVLGYEAILLGTAKLVKEGEPATVRLISVRQEVGKDDRLVAAPRPDIVSYPLHKPKNGVTSSVVSIYGGSTAGGRYSTVAISGGEKSGIERGHVLALSRSGEVITDRYRDGKTEVTLPNERYGLIYVFRTFQKISYALVMEAREPIEVGDVVSTP
jgi:LysM repeat protein